MLVSRAGENLGENEHAQTSFETLADGVHGVLSREDLGKGRRMPRTCCSVIPGSDDSRASPIWIPGGRCLHRDGSLACNMLSPQPRSRVPLVQFRHQQGALWRPVAARSEPPTTVGMSTRLAERRQGQRKKTGRGCRHVTAHLYKPRPDASLQSKMGSSRAMPWPSVTAKKAEVCRPRTGGDEIAPRGR